MKGLGRPARPGRRGRALRRSAAALLLAGMLFGGGCDDETPDPELVALSMVEYLPFAVVVPKGEEMRQAEQFAASHPGHIVLRGLAVRRLAHYGDSGGLVVKECAFEDLRPGMTIVYVAAEGWRAGGLLVAHDEAGWIVKDWGAERVKRERVRPETLVGVLVLVFVSTDNLPDLALRKMAAPAP